jgi:hypothetical protein
MKQNRSNGEIEVLHKIESIEDEVLDLKLSVLKKLTPLKKNVLSLKGILKGVDISDEDVRKAQKELYGKIEI